MDRTSGKYFEKKRWYDVDFCNDCALFKGCKPDIASLANRCDNYTKCEDVDKFIDLLISINRDKESNNES